MNLIMFTPVNVKSAIGKMAALVTYELVAQGCRVTVISTDESFSTIKTHDFNTQILSWESENKIKKLILDADMGVYQIGDNFNFHVGAIHWLKYYPGLVCLHDFFLGSLFRDWLEIHRTQAKCILRKWYGEKRMEQFFLYTDDNSRSFIEGACDEMPMVEWICSQADGVITHSKWGCDRVLKSCPGPVRVVPLAYKNAVPMSSGLCDDAPFTNQKKNQILTIGYINFNKRVDSVIEAIGNSSLLKEQVSYHLVGSITPEMHGSLSSLAEKKGVDLVISGEVDDETFARALAESDIVCCLRWPVLEAASASAIEAMLYGKPVIVIDAGFYSEIPDSCVVKINHENEVEELQLAIESLVQNNVFATKLGDRAKSWASEEFTAQNYALQLIDMTKEILKTVPTKTAIRYFCDVLHSWSCDEEIIDSLGLTDSLKIFS